MLGALLVVACARMGTPDGGLFDEDPPKIVRTSPEAGSLKSKSKKITLHFNEIVKLENAAENIVVSPPQTEQPEIEADGRKVTVELLDSLKPNVTYTIDFGNSIVDNNEGNPMGAYTFSFSTGEALDTMQVAGSVLDAENLEPVKGMLVGLYRMPEDSLPLPDSVFKTKQIERLGRTNSSGKFTIKGVAPGSYRIFALNDQDQNYMYSQRSERIAFLEDVIVPSAKEDMRHDTIWHDSIHYDTIIDVRYMHYFPDNLVLRSFVAENTDRYLMKSERAVPSQFVLTFSSPCDTLPRLRGIGFDIDENTFVIEPTQHNDTITYWIRDSLVCNMDTLSMCLDFYATDTLGELSLRTDTLELTSKLTRAKIEKQKKEEYEEYAKDFRKEWEAKQKALEREEELKAKEEGRKIDKKEKKERKKRMQEMADSLVIPPMPEEQLPLKISNTNIAPDQNVTFELPEPIDTLYEDHVRFTMKVDTLFEPAPFLLRRISGEKRKYRLYAEWEPDSTYRIEIDSAAFVCYTGNTSSKTQRDIKVKSMDSFTTLFVVLQQADTAAYVELLNSNDKVIKRVKAQDGKADFYFITPGTYYMRTYYDKNGNGIWDTGDYDKGLQPEPLYYYPNSMQLKAKWEITQTWNPTTKELDKQKPAAITKQKPDKQKTIQNRNAMKLAERQKNKKK